MHVVASEMHDSDVDLVTCQQTCPRMLLWWFMHEREKELPGTPERRAVRGVRWWGTAAGDGRAGGGRARQQAACAPTVEAQNY